MSQTLSVPTSLFDLLILSLGNAALAGLGLVPNPLSDKVERDLETVEHNVELLTMLKEKTRGNLTRAEEKLLDDLMFDLRMKYVEAKRQASAPSVP